MTSDSLAAERAEAARSELTFADCEALPIGRRRHAQTISQPVVCGLLRALDAVWVFSSALLSLALYGRINPGYTYQPIVFVLIGLVAAFSADAVFAALNLYEFAAF